MRGLFAFVALTVPPALAVGLALRGSRADPALVCEGCNEAYPIDDVLDPSTTCACVGVVV